MRHKIGDKIISNFEGPAGFWPIVRLLQFYKVEVSVNQLRMHLMRLVRSGLLARTDVAHVEYGRSRKMAVWSLTVAGGKRQAELWAERRAARQGTPHADAQNPP